jgi:hypothetical protein
MNLFSFYKPGTIMRARRGIYFSDFGNLPELLHGVNFDQQQTVFFVILPDQMGIKVIAGNEIYVTLV